MAAPHPDRSGPGRGADQGHATTRRSTPASPGAGARTKLRSPSPTPCSRPPGTSSPPVPSTKIPVPTTSSAVTIRPLRRSGSNAGSRRSGSRHHHREGRVAHTLRQLHLVIAPTGASFCAPASHHGSGISPEHPMIDLPALVDELGQMRDPGEKPQVRRLVDRSRCDKPSFLSSTA